jgi:phosphoglycerate dehydrogenase-like enzyme
MATKPLMLLTVAETAPFREALGADGLLDRFEVAEVAPGARPSADQLARAEVVLAMSLPPGVLAEMPRLRWLQSMTAGVDHWLARKDLPASLVITAARGTHRIQMPENILGALFHVTKHYHEIALNQREAKWVRSTSTSLAGSTLGILGLGAIGQELARKAAALEMRVIGTKRTGSAVPHVDRVFPPEETDAVLGESDYVVLLLPVTPKTENMFDLARISRMKPTAWLMNFARGALIVDADLITAVREKRIAGAVLDVFRTEPLPSSDPYWSTPGIVVLPHIGGLHPKRNAIVARLFSENARRFLAGEPLKEAVDRARGY